MTWIVNGSIALAILASYVALSFGARRAGTRNVALSVAGSVLMGTALWSMHTMAASLLGWHSLLTNSAAMSVLPFSFGVMQAAACIVAHELWRRDRTEKVRNPSVGSSPREEIDLLTRLPNRIALAAEAQVALAKAQLRSTPLAVLVLNVDRLARVNDSLGHHIGDELLLELSRRLRSVLRRRDLLARLAGDEFAILATDLGDARDAEAIAMKVLAALQRPFLAGSVNVHPSVSIGISMFPADGENFPRLLSRANAAMRYAKNLARGTHRFYAAEMSRISEDRLALENDLRLALHCNQLELHYQPKVDIATGRIRSAEALIRWRHPARGMVPPSVFIPIAEETGMILPIGHWVLREACRQTREWIDAGMTPVRVAVNLSAQQFREADLAATVRSALAAAQLQPGHIELELTESAVMHDAEQSIATLQALSAMGVHISIDDFGTGYSSLSYLRRFPLDKLKIDRSFIRDLLTSSDDASIVRAIISLAHSLRLRVVAEGVETQEQLEFLRELGCDQYQGFHCSPPVPADAFVDLVARLRAELDDIEILRTPPRAPVFTSAAAG